MPNRLGPVGCNQRAQSFRNDDSETKSRKVQRTNPLTVCRSGRAAGSVAERPTRGTNCSTRPLTHERRAAPNLHSTANHWHGVSLHMAEVEQCRDFGRARPGVKTRYTVAANSSLTVGTAWPAAGTGLWGTDCGEIFISFVGGYGISQRWYLFYANYPRHPN